MDIKSKKAKISSRSWERESKNGTPTVNMWAWDRVKMALTFKDDGGEFPEKGDIISVEGFVIGGGVDEGNGEYESTPFVRVYVTAWDFSEEEGDRPRGRSAARGGRTGRNSRNSGGRATRTRTSNRRPARSSRQEAPTDDFDDDIPF